MVATATMRDTLGQAYVDRVAEVSLFNGDPLAGGTEIAGGAPPYVRRTPTWTGDADGVFTSSTMEFDVPAGEVTHAAVHDAGGAILDTCLAAGTFTDQGVMRLTLVYDQD